MSIEKIRKVWMKKNNLFSVPVSNVTFCYITLLSFTSNYCTSCYQTTRLMNPLLLFCLELYDMWVVVVPHLMLRGFFFAGYSGFLPS